MQHTLKRTRHIKWDNVIALAVVVSLITALLLSVWLFFSIDHTLDIMSTEHYTVQYGDTLWGIAKQSNGYNRIDTRIIVDDIMELSDCTTTIHYGQTVQIPIYEED